MLTPVLLTVAIWFVYVGSGHWSALLEQRVGAALANHPAQAEWASVAISGRDVLLSGEAPDQSGLDAAIALLAASQMKAGVGRSPSPTQSLITSAFGQA